MVEVGSSVSETEIGRLNRQTPAIDAFVGRPISLRGTIVIQEFPVPSDVSLDPVIMDQRMASRKVSIAPQVDILQRDEGIYWRMLYQVRCGDGLVIQSTMGCIPQGTIIIPLLSA